MKDLLEGLLQGSDLTVEEAETLLRLLTGGEMDPASAGAVLIALRAKGETPEEVLGFARAMRELATDPEIDV
ncbi:MAG TPA: anthranilate phosphoribosyltransferase, partial [Acidimicrobiia bacterium]|nr:anthranilate phosphoribosyltransferase [Acidimicrobiia bacterium]